VFGKTCVYLNDISQGFNSSIFMSWGHIEDYQTRTDTLGSHLAGLFHSQPSVTSDID